MTDRSIPSLDGLRAVSIGLVLWSHAAVGMHFGSFAPSNAVGELGVQIFFVISGYLITKLLLKEYVRTSRLRLGAFYLRRATRIMPAYFVYLAVVAGAIAMGWLQWPSDGRWWPALTYTSNVVPTNAWAVGHSWSLSVEEQFYLTWPFALAKLGPKRARWVALAAILSGPVIRALIFGATRDGFRTGTWNHDLIAMGCLLALMEDRLQRHDYWRALMNSRLFVLIPISALALFLGTIGGFRWVFAFYVLVGIPLVGLGITLTVAWCIHNSRGRIGRLLNCQPLRAAGILSYSLYLWQECFLTTDRRNSIPVAIGCAVLMAVASYYLVERPGIRLRQWLTKHPIKPLPRVGYTPGSVE